MDKHIDPYQPLFDLMTNYGLTLLLGEMQEIVEVCKPLIESDEIIQLNGIIGKYEYECEVISKKEIYIYGSFENSNQKTLKEINELCNQLKIDYRLIKENKPLCRFSLTPQCTYPNCECYKEQPASEPTQLTGVFTGQSIEDAAEEYYWSESAQNQLSNDRVNLAFIAGAKYNQDAKVLVSKDKVLEIIEGIAKEYVAEIDLDILTKKGIASNEIRIQVLTNLFNKIKEL